MLAREGLAFVRDLPKVEAVAQHGEQALLVNDLSIVAATVLRDPHLGGVPLDLQFAHELRGGSGFGIPRKMSLTNAASGSLIMSFRSRTS